MEFSTVEVRSNVPVEGFVIELLHSHRTYVMDCSEDPDLDGEISHNWSFVDTQVVAWRQMFDCRGFSIKVKVPFPPSEMVAPGYALRWRGGTIYFSAWPGEDNVVSLIHAGF